jgi:hypothetical protein
MITRHAGLRRCGWPLMLIGLLGCIGLAGCGSHHRSASSTDSATSARCARSTDLQAKALHVRFRVPRGWCWSTPAVEPPRVVVANDEMFLAHDGSRDPRELRIVMVERFYAGAKAIDTPGEPVIDGLFELSRDRNGATFVRGFAFRGGLYTLRVFFGRRQVSQLGLERVDQVLRSFRLR